MIRRSLPPLVALAAAGALSSCTDSTTVPAAGFSTPVAIVTARQVAQDGTQGDVVFIANADTNDLRAFEPNRGTTGLFVRGPNAISALAIPVGFRPERLASGVAATPAPASPGATPAGFVVVSGAAPALAVVDAQTFRLALPAAPAPGCAAGFSVCLPAPALDVATSTGDVFAVLAPDAAGKSALAVLASSVETRTVPDPADPSKTIQASVPLLALTTTLPLTGSPTGLGALSDGTRVFVADGAAPRVVEVTVAGGATRDITAAAPVRDVVVVPRYTDAKGTQHPEGQFILALLADGRMQTLDPATGGPAADPLDPAKPIEPLQAITNVTGTDLPTPVQDVTFVPCQGTPCVSSVRENTVSGTPVVTAPLLAFAALGDGAALALVPDEAAPQLFRPIDTAAAGPTAGTPAFVDPTTKVPTSVPTLTVDTLTEGVTRSETFTVTQNGLVPGFRARPASLADAGGGTLTLTDTLGGFDAPNAAAVGDTVAVRSGGCPELLAATLVVSAVAPTTLTLTAPTPALPAGCVPAGPAPLRISYDLRAGGTASWTVTGTASGYAGRATPGTPFVVAGQRFAYPAGAAPSAATAPALAFTLSPSAASAPAGALFTFGTNSGFSPFEIRPESFNITPERFSLANSIASTAGRLFVALTGNNAMLDARLANLGEQNTVSLFR